MMGEGKRKEGKNVAEKERTNEGNCKEWLNVKECKRKEMREITQE